MIIEAKFGEMNNVLECDMCITAHGDTSHITNRSNPHKVTAEQTGARPNTWTPTAEEVGARPNTWMPTASDVGAAPAASVAYIDKNDNETVILPPSGGDGGDSSPGSGGLTAEQVQAMIDAALGGIENGTY